MDYDLFHNAAYDHYRGALVSFNNHLTAVAGVTDNVEVLVNNTLWDADRIPPFTKRNWYQASQKLEAIVIPKSSGDVMFVFGTCM